MTDDKIKQALEDAGRFTDPMKLLRPLILLAEKYLEIAGKIPAEKNFNSEVCAYRDGPPSLIKEIRIQCETHNKIRQECILAYTKKEVK